MTLGIISDTHGLLRPEAVAALRGSELIIHAGDVGTLDVLVRLRAIAPTVAVRGNVDVADWAKVLPVAEVVAAGGPHPADPPGTSRLLYVVHDLATLDLDPRAAGFAAVISGHSHRPGAETRNGVLYLNPGSAGPRRFKLPVSIARLHVTGTQLRHEIIALEV